MKVQEGKTKSGYEDSHPIFRILTDAVNEVTRCWLKMPAAYKRAFGDSICQSMGQCGSYLAVAQYKSTQQEKIRCLNAADGHLAEVKFWVSQSPNLFYITKTGAKRYSIPPKRAASCTAALLELGRLIGGWKGSLQSLPGRPVQQ